MYGQDLRPVAPPYNYAAVSVSNVVATFCQYEALKHVSFPMQASVRVDGWGSVQGCTASAALACGGSAAAHSPAGRPMGPAFHQPASDMPA
jgi:hypothetical protein